MLAAPAARARAGTAFVLLAVAIGVTARFVTRSSLWLDEALSVNIASLPLGDIPEALRHDGHPPLYYWLLHLWMIPFGDGDLGARSLSGVVAVASLPLAWMAGHRLGGRRTAGVALVLVCLTPYVVRYGTEARMYSLVMFLVLLGYVALARVLESGSLPWAALVAVSAGCLTLTHYWALYLLAVTGSVLVWRWRALPAERPHTSRAIAAVALGCLAFVPWIPSFLEQAEHTGTPWAEPARPSQVIVETLDALGGGAFAEARLFGIILALAVLIGAFRSSSAEHSLVLSDVVNPRVRREVVVGTATVALGTVAGLLAGGAFAARYAAVVVPILLVVAAVGLSASGARRLLGTLAALLILLGLVGIGDNVTYDRTQSDDLAAAIVAAGGGDDVVVVCPDQLGPSLERALRKRGAQTPIPYPTAGDPRFVDWRDYADRNAQADPAAFAEQILADAGDAPIWLVWNGTYRTFEGQCEALASLLGAGRPTAIVATVGDAFEPANLYRFG